MTTLIAEIEEGYVIGCVFERGDKKKLGDVEERLLESGFLVRRLDLAL